MHGRRNLPVTRVAAPDESGMSLLLRIASANLVTLSWLRCRLNVLQPRPFRSEDAVSLASLVDVAPRELASRLPDSGWFLGRTVTQYFGVMVLSRVHHRFARPQVCPECLHTTGYCRAAWDFSCYTVCEEHMTRMVDSCAACRRRLTWNRPSIDVCACGAYIRSVDGPRASKQLAAGFISRRISAALLGEVSAPSASLESSDDLPGWWGQLSLDGSMRLLTALGAIERPFSATKVAELQQASSATWQSIVERGLDRLRWVSKRQDEELEQLAPVVWEGCLESIALDHINEPDRQVAQLLAESIFGQRLAGRFGSLRGQLSQRRLF